MRRILVAYDDSEGARRALEEAITEAHAKRSQITVLAVAEMPLDPQAPRAYGSAGDIAAWEGKALHAPPEVIESLGAARDRLVAARLNADLVWAAGEPGAAIVDAAKAARASVIILGEHHHGFLGRLFGADVAAQVLRRADCEVLVV